jgi:hypothetical protein
MNINPSRPGGLSKRRERKLAKGPAGKGHKLMLEEHSPVARPYRSKTQQESNHE